MSLLAVILALLLLALVVFVVGGPIRAARERAATPPANAAGADAAAERAAYEPAPGSPRAELDELETAREAKYREIRDAELDYRTGKLSREDYAAIDADLRAEAIEILDRIERVQARMPGGGAPAAGADTPDAAPLTEEREG